MVRMLLCSHANKIPSNFIPVTTFVVSAIVSHQHKLDMVHIQNSTLAGGVAIGSCCNLLVSPHGAILIGMVSAIISVFGYRYLTVGYISIRHIFIAIDSSLSLSFCLVCVPVQHAHNTTIDCSKIVLLLSISTWCCYASASLFSTLISKTI